MYCTNCGAAIQDDSRYCENCGAPVEQSAPAQSAPSPYQPGISAPASVAAAQNSSAPANIAAAPQAAAPYLANQGQQKSAPSRLLIIIGALALAAVVAAMTLFILSRTTPAATTAPTLSESSVSAGVGGSISSDVVVSSVEAAPVILPDLVGLSEAEARSRIEALGNFTVETSTEKSETVAEGGVLSQSPNAGAELADGSAIHLIVSEGKPIHTYEFVNQAMTWTDASQYAEEHGGMLACVTSAEEWDSVRNTIPSDKHVVWLGGYRDASGNFCWISGEDLSFNAWASGEPNNDGGNEDCLCVLRSNDSLAWYDTPRDVSAYYSADKMGFVVEYVN